MIAIVEREDFEGGVEVFFVAVPEERLEAFELALGAMNRGYRMIGMATSITFRSTYHVEPDVHFMRPGAFRAPGCRERWRLIPKAYRAHLAGFWRCWSELSWTEQALARELEQDP